MALTAVVNNRNNNNNNIIIITVLIITTTITMIIIIIIVNLLKIIGFVSFLKQQFDLRNLEQTLVKTAC